MALVPYKQSLSHSCLAACFLMLLEKEFSVEEEHSLALRGSKRTHAYYVTGIPWEFAKTYKKDITVYVDYKVFSSELENVFSTTKQIHVRHEKITLPLILKLLNKGPLICHIDDHALGAYSHLSHFIVLEKATEKSIVIIDPWFGKRRSIRFETLETAINELKKQVKMSPLIYTID